MGSTTLRHVGVVWVCTGSMQARRTSEHRVQLVNVGRGLQLQRCGRPGGGTCRQVSSAGATLCKWRAPDERDGWRRSARKRERATGGGTLRRRRRRSRTSRSTAAHRCTGLPGARAIGHRESAHHGAAKAASSTAEGAPKLGFNEPLKRSQLDLLYVGAECWNRAHTRCTVVAAMARQQEDIQTLLATGNLASVKPLIDGKDVLMVVLQPVGQPATAILTNVRVKCSFQRTSGISGKAS